MGVPVPYSIREVDGKSATIMELIDDLHDQCFPDYDQSRLSLTGSWWIVRDLDEDEPAAFCGLWPSVRTPEAGYLARSGVLPAHRGRGLQRRMIKLRERKARNLGWISMLSDTVEDNTASANNLIRCGYTLWLPPVRWATEGSLYWRRELVSGVG